MLIRSLSCIYRCFKAAHAKLWSLLPGKYFYSLLIAQTDSMCLRLGTHLDVRGKQKDEDISFPVDFEVEFTSVEVHLRVGLEVILYLPDGAHDVVLELLRDG